MATTIVKNIDIDGVDHWYWPDTDTGAWGNYPHDGPAAEWAGLRDHILNNCRERRVIVQAGGCCGMYPRLWSKYFEFVWTFEPEPGNFHHLTLNTMVYNVFKFQAALGEKSGTARLELNNEANVGMHRITSRGLQEDHVHGVALMAIDDLNLPYCDAIQLDVEHSEHFAIRGALKTIEKFRPVIAVETVHHDMRQIFDRFGYREVGRNAVDTIWRAG